MPIDEVVVGVDTSTLSVSLRCCCERSREMMRVSTAVFLVVLAASILSVSISYAGLTNLRSFCFLWAVSRIVDRATNGELNLCVVLC